MLRGFTDSTGVEWRVWEVFPSRPTKSGGADALSQTSLKDSPFENGWLCFESAESKRRLAPIPNGWEFSSANHLDALCQSATVVPLRRRGGATRPEPSAAPGAA
jgi:hypothetical protein